MDGAGRPLVGRPLTPRAGPARIKRRAAGAGPGVLKGPPRFEAYAAVPVGGKASIGEPR